MRPSPLITRARSSTGSRPGEALDAPDALRVDEAEEGGRLVLGDALTVAPVLTAAQADLLYLDPPFATGGERRGRRADGGARLAFADRWDGGLPEYLDWLAALLAEAHRLLRSTGSLVLHLDYRAAPAARLLLDALFGPDRFLGEIIWHYGSGGRARHHFHRKHDTLLWYARGPNQQFFPEAVSVPRRLCPACGRDREQWNHLRRATDAAGRTFRSIRSAGREYRYYDDERVLPPDVWQDISHLQQRDPERVGWPTQKPLRLLERLIAAFTQAGDRVVDLCAGSGTSLVAAARGGRRWLGVEASPDAAAICWRRLLDEDRGAIPMRFETCGVEGWGEGSLDEALALGNLTVARAQPVAGRALALISGLLRGVSDDPE